MECNFLSKLYYILFNMCLCVCVHVCVCVSLCSWEVRGQLVEGSPLLPTQRSQESISIRQCNFNKYWLQVIHSFFLSLILGQSLTLWPTMFSKVQSACLSFHRFRITLLSPTGNLLKRHPLTLQKPILLFSSPPIFIPQNNFLCSLRWDLSV